MGRSGPVGAVGMLSLIVFLGAACAGAPAPLAETPDAGAVALVERASAVFGVLPDVVPNPANVLTPAKIKLGRMLYYEKRLSKNYDIACNSCHPLDAYGVDEDTTLPVAALSGVLSNDTDAEGNPLTAALVTGPANGALVLNADGSFNMPELVRTLLRIVWRMRAITLSHIGNPWSKIDRSVKEPHDIAM